MKLQPTDEQKQIIKDTIKGIVDNHFSSILNYELSGWDFLERIQGELPTDFEIEVRDEVETPVRHYDTELYNKFINDVVEVVYENLKF